MAFDGITIAAMVKEIKTELEGGRFNKIAQPEPDELLITAKGFGSGQRRLLLSASASLPLIYFTEKHKVKNLINLLILIASAIFCIFCTGTSNIIGYLSGGIK